jgi:mRNA interferase MazF
MANRVVKRGSVVLVRYPFTDLTGVKVRPAVIMTPDEFISKLDDVICLFISSSIPEELLPTDLILETTYPSFSKTGLKYRSVFRAHKLALLQKSLVLRVLGEMDNSLMNEINRCLRIALGLS